MDIVRITLSGYGYEVSRGIITMDDYDKIEGSERLNNIWVKDLYKSISKNTNGIDLQQDYGITSGDIIITVNDETILDIPINVLSSTNSDMVEFQQYRYPETDDVVITTIQEHSGIICDILLVSAHKFDIDKLKFISKNVYNEENVVIIKSLISEVYYDDQLIPFGGSKTDLRMSNVYFDVKNETKR